MKLVPEQGPALKYSRVNTNFRRCSRCFSWQPQNRISRCLFHMNSGKRMWNGRSLITPARISKTSARQRPCPCHLSGPQRKNSGPLTQAVEAGGTAGPPVRAAAETGRSRSKYQCRHNQPDPDPSHSFMCDFRVILLSNHLSFSLTGSSLLKHSEAGSSRSRVRGLMTKPGEPSAGAQPSAGPTPGAAVVLPKLGVRKYSSSCNEIV